MTNWRNEIQMAEKREKDYRKEGQKILDIYTGKKKSPFNILYSNTETMMPALYSAIPRPIVSRRFKDDDPMALHASRASERVLEYLLDTNTEGYETFDEGMRFAVLDALLPGRAVTSVKYDAEIEETEPTEGEVDAYKKGELVCISSRAWNRVLFGYARKWSEVPWVAFEDFIDKKEAVRLFGEQIAENLVFSDEKDETDEEKRGVREEEKSGRKVARIYQIWEKASRKVIYISDQAQDILKEEDDPLEVSGFFNIPKPMMFMEKSSDLTPTALYKLYEEQAGELNRIQRRINKLVEAIKARGLYDSSLGGDLADLIRAGDNELVPADSNSSLAAEKGLDAAIWWMPIEQLINTLTQLYQARESCKQVIYEIMGISDILRGASVASETATAQNIKSQWGSLRLKRIQREVQRYARDLMRIMLEVAINKFDEETWAKMTGLPFVTTEQRQADERLFQIVQQQMMMQPPPTPGPDGQQPPPTPLQQEAQRLQAELQKPVWGEVIGLLKDDLERTYRIDIETNSTLEPEAAEDQKAISDMLAAFGQAMNGFGPMIQQGMLPFEVAQTLLLAICRRYRFGRELEDLVKGMQQPPPPPDPNQAKAQAEQAKMQAEMQAEQARMQNEAQMEQVRVQAELQKAQGLAEIEVQKEQARQAAETERFRLQLEFDRRSEQAKHATDTRIEQEKMQNELKKAAIQVAGQIVTAKMAAESNPEEGEEVEAEEPDRMAEILAGNQEVLKITQDLIKAVTAPIKHERDPKTGLITQSVRVGVSNA